MSTENSLLLIDLCARLPYDVNVRIEDGRVTEDCVLIPEHIELLKGGRCKIRPYLRSLAEMTLEEEDEFFHMPESGHSLDIYDKLRNISVNSELIAWLDKHGFDHRGLIPLGFAIKITDGAYDTEMNNDESIRKELLYFIQQEKKYLEPKVQIENSPKLRFLHDAILYLERQAPGPWNEEDENRFRNLIWLVEHSDEGLGSKRGFVNFINRLKSLRPQHHWKPSKEQMDILDKVYHYLWADRNATADMQDGLGDFIDELKEL